MSIILGDQIQAAQKTAASVAASFDRLDESFEIATPEVRASYVKAKEAFAN